MINKAIITNVFYGEEDHGILTFYVTVKYDSGTSQGFGGLSLDVYNKPLEKRINIGFGEYVRNEIPKVLGVKDWDSLVNIEVDVDNEDYIIDGIGRNGSWIRIDDLRKVGKQFYNLHKL